MIRPLIIFLLSCLFLQLTSQTLPFKENGKWGIKENDNVLIAPLYDTLFNFDKTKSLCLACFKLKSSNSNKFIKVSTTHYYCNYLNSKSQRLILTTGPKDTCSVFSLGKNTVNLYNDNDTLFKVSVKNNKYLVSKNFKQLTFHAYYDIDLCDDPNYYVTQILSEAEVPLTGLVTAREVEIIPNNYSGIKMNPVDSLIMVCGAGVRNNSEDYVFDYSGKQKQAYRHHIDLATKNYIIFKHFEPKEHYTFYKIETKEEKELIADEVKYYAADEIKIRIKNAWWIYHLNTNEKTELKK